MLECYDPEHSVDSAEWLALNDDERSLLVTDFVEKNEPSVGPALLHAHIHVVIENQVALGDETPVEEAVERLTAEGLSRHDAIHAIGTCLAALFTAPAEGKEISEDSYFESVRNLTAQSWLAMLDED